MCIELINQCINECREDKSNPQKYIRALITCIVNKLGFKPIIVNPGPKFNYVIYLEFRSKNDYEDAFNKLNNCFNELKKIEGFNFKVIDWGVERYIMFSKEYLILKLVW